MSGQHQPEGFSTLDKAALCAAFRCLFAVLTSCRDPLSGFHWLVNERAASVCVCVWLGQRRLSPSLSVLSDRLSVLYVECSAQTATVVPFIERKLSSIENIVESGLQFPASSVIAFWPWPLRQQRL